MFELDNETSWSESDELFNVDTKNESTNFSDYFDGGRVRSALDIPYVTMELIVAIFAVIGNATVIIVFFRERKLRKRTNYYIISLAFADFFVGLFGIPIAILISIGIPKNYTTCLLVTSLLLSFCTISIFSLVLISVDRFMSILFPLKYCDDKSCVNAEIICAWLLGLVVGFLPFAWHQDRPVQKCFYHAVVCENYQMFRFVFVVLIPFCIITTIYGMIYKVVLHQLKHEKLFRKTACFYHGASDSQSCVNLATRREIKVTLNIFIIVLFFTICWLPLNTIKTVKILCRSCTIPSYFITFGIVLTHFNSAVNPFLFAYHLKDFRHAITKLFHLRRRESISSF